MIEVKKDGIILEKTSLVFENEGVLNPGIIKEGNTVSLEFTVSDTGIGIAKKNQASIFDDFQQATGEISRLYGGTGLGLAIVKRLVQAQGGSTKVMSEEGIGSTFSFILDFNKTKLLPETKHTELSAEEKNKSKGKILIVEDMALNQLLMKTLLDDFGFESDTAANGKIAIEKLKTNNYNLVLMDLQMPEMNGFEATEYIRKEMRLNIPIIALSADVTTVDAKKCQTVGMNDYISKPVDEKTLHQKLLLYLNREPLTTSMTEET